MPKVKLGSIFLLFLVANLIAFNSYGTTKNPSLPIDIALNEANKSFTYQGKPIHPYLIKEFEIWLSDNCPSVTVSVCIVAAAKARNEYSNSSVVVKGKRIEVTEPNEYYAYEHIGTLKNGLHVLKTYNGGEGTGVFENLFFIKFGTDKAYDEDGKIYDRLLMTVVREYVLGDRDESKIKIDGDKVIISKSKYREKEIVLRF